MKPIRITYDRKGNVLSIRFSEKKEACSRERRPSKKLPVQTRILLAS